MKKKQHQPTNQPAIPAVDRANQEIRTTHKHTAEKQCELYKVHIFCCKSFSIMLCVRAVVVVAVLFFVECANDCIQTEQSIFARVT